MRKKKILLTAGLGLLSCTLLTSCDYSNFSLFGFFYNIWEHNYENSLTGGKTSSSDEKEETNFKPQTYRVTSSSEIEGATIEKTQLLNLITDDYATLTSYERWVSKTDATNSKTYKSFNAVGNYTRDGNVVTFDVTKGVSTYVDRTSATQYKSGNSETARKENFTTVFGTDAGKFALSGDGTFAVGETASSDTLYTGLSTCNTYFLMERSGRPTDQVINFFDDGTYSVLSFALDSKNHEQPVSAFFAYGTYKKFPEQATETYDVVQLKRDGRGHMYASNNGSDMEFDLNTNESFLQWYALSIGKYRSLKITKVGYTDSVTFDKINPYGFQVMDNEVEQDEDPVVPAEKEALIELTGKQNNTYKLSIYKDGTYKFVGAASEEGTWVYDKDEDVLTLTCGERINTFAASEDGTTYEINYIFSRSEQLTQEFSMTKDEWDSLFRILFHLEGVNKNITLTIYANGKYHFEFKGQPASEDGTWVYNKQTDALDFTIGEKTQSSTKNADGSYFIHYVYSKSDKLTQDYTISKADWDKSFQRVVASLKGEVLKTTTLELYSDNTYQFNFIREAQGAVLASEAGTWSIDEKGTVSLTNDGKTVSKFEKQADGSYKIHFVYAKSDQLTQDFVIDAYHFNVLTKKNLLTLKDKNEKFTISFLADDTYAFEFEVQGHTGKETGGYKYDSETDSVTLTCKDKVNTLSKQDDGSYKLNYISKLNDALTQEFTLYTQTMRQTFAKSYVKLTTESQVQPYFNIYSDGTYDFGFAKYGKSERGTWTYDEENDKFDFRCYGKTNSFTFDSTKNVYTGKYVSNMSEQMTQEFTLTLEQAKQFRRKTLVNIENNNASGTKFTFDFYEDHEYKFSFVNYGVNEYGTWSYDETSDTFTFVCNNTKNTATKQEDGSYLIHYVSDRSSSMKQDYVLTAEKAALLK